MTSSRPHDPLDDVLRSLDAAAPTLTRAQAADAAALLESLTAAPADVPRRPRRALRWLAPAAAAAALVAGALILPGPATTDAYADWTPEPTPVAAPLLTRVADACRSRLAEWERTGAVIRPDTARLVVAEQRGSHVLVALVTDSDAEIQCLAEARTGRVTGSTGGAPTSESVPVALAPRAILANGGGLQSDGRSGFAFSTGRVGAEVRAVTIHAAGRTVTASLNQGAFVAWWPVAPPAPGEPVLDDASYDVTLADGTIVRDVPTGHDRGRPGPTEIGRVQRGGGLEGGTAVGFAAGLVGSRVVAVTVHVDGRDVPAIVAHGAFRARWNPSDPRPSGRSVTYTLTLDDGTVLAHVKPASGADS